jgi:multiple sugar transport system substrate-binding protein
MLDAIRFTVAGRWVRQAVLWIMLLTLVTACSGAAGGTTSTAPTTTPATDAPAEATEAATTVAGAATPTPLVAGEVAREPGTIQITTIGGAMDQTMNKLARAFELANPGIKVQVLVEPSGGVFEALIAAGNQPDLIVGAFGSMHAKYAAMGALVPLDDLPGAQELFARLDPIAMHQDLGQQYYVPLGLDVQAMIYNKELFEEAGLDPNKPPQTFDEFLAAAEQLQALPARADGSTVYGTVFWNEATAWGGWYWNMLQPIYLNYNHNQCQLLNRLGTDIVFDKPECEMDAFFDFAKRAQQFAPPTMEKNFFSRTIGMWLQYSYSWEPGLQEAAERPMVMGEDIAVARIPVAEAGDTSYTALSGRPLMMMKTTPERQELAWKFVQFLMEDQNSLQFIKELGYLPALNSLKGDPYFTEPGRKPFVDLLEHAVFPQALANMETVANPVLATYQEAVVDGKLDPQAAVDQAAERAREALAQP